MNLDRPTPPDPYSQLPALPALTVESPDFADGAPLPESASYGSDNVSPALRWSGAPEGTKSFLITCYDPDAPTPSGFWHWVLADVPADVDHLDAGAGSTGQAAYSGGLHLRNDYGTTDFGGAAPPEGDRPHRYIFAVTAMGVEKLGLESDTSPAKAHFLSLEHQLARGTVTGTFQL